MTTGGLPHRSAVLLDRDGTLVEDVPYNGDPRRVRPVPHAREALDLLRGKGVRLAVVTNQSGVGRGLLTGDQVRAVHKRLTDLLGPFDDWRFCPHVTEDRCACRKPAPGMLLAACAALGVRPDRAVMIGDIGADVAAAHAAGVHAIMVPTPQTLPGEVSAAPLVADDLLAAARLALDLLAGVPA